MAPSITEATLANGQQIPAKLTALTTNDNLVIKQSESSSQHREPLKLIGILDQFTSFDVTPAIGREFSGVNLVDWLRAPNSDDLLRDLAITTQDALSNDLQKELIQRIGELAGKPATSKLHIHPIINASRDHGGKDDEISTISSAQAKTIYSSTYYDKKQSAKGGWHSDITFEPIPSDYAILRLTQLPRTGGDTLWASGYEVFDRISRPVQRFLESLTATYAQPKFNEAAQKNGFEIFAEERGAPENIGEKLEAVHPVIRTNPVTGWKSVFAVGSHVQSINDLAEEESRALLNWFLQLIVENHDLQVRHRWQNENDVAIWDNRSVYHAATPDYINQDLGERTGQRAVSLGERPYFDPLSRSRTDVLHERRKANAANVG